MRLKLLGTAGTLAIMALPNPVLLAQGAAPTTPTHWVTAWSAAVHTPVQFPGAPPPLTVNQQTVREIIRPTIGGEHLRVRFSNEFGTSPLPLRNAHIALVQKDGSIITGSDRPLTFNGAAAVDIPAGAPMLSDPVEMKVTAFADIAISIYVPRQVTASTFHQLGQLPTRISSPGDFTSAQTIPNATQIPSWFWLSDLELLEPQQASAVVTFGDSITDGFGGKPGEYQDWPDLLAKRLAQAGGPLVLAVDNEGIGGNRILHDGAGVSALARFDRDVLGKPGVSEIILLEGINDIGWPNMRPPATATQAMQKGPFADQVVTAFDIILGMKQLIERAHQHGIQVFGATMTPYEGAGYFTAEGEAVREKVNAWVRTGGAFDGIIDFDAAVRDPQHPTRFREDYQIGDHLHPNAAGYQAMAAAVNVEQLQAAAQSSSASAPAQK